MDIGEVIQRAGLPASTLRFYEDKKLIKPVGRNGLRRIHDSDLLERLALIALGRNAGFTLEEIAAIFTPSSRHDAWFRTSETHPWWYRQGFSCC